MPAFRPKRLPFLIDVCAQWIVNEEETRIAVFMPATPTGQARPGRRPGVALGDADEEVGGEERAEDHHLGDDEEQHPEQLGLDPRAAVGRRGAVVLAVRRPRG